MNLQSIFHCLQVELKGRWEEEEEDTGFQQCPEGSRVASIPLMCAAERLQICPILGLVPQMFILHKNDSLKKRHDSTLVRQKAKPSNCLPSLDRGLMYWFWDWRNKRFPRGIQHGWMEEESCWTYSERNQLKKGFLLQNLIFIFGSFQPNNSWIHSATNSKNVKHTGIQNQIQN